MEGQLVARRGREGIIRRGREGIIRKRRNL
jgi:hypothetical protein